MTRIQILIIAACASLTGGVIGCQVTADYKARQAHATSIDTRSYTLECGAYNMVIVAHDEASIEDARETAFAGFNSNCELLKGNHPEPRS